MTSIIGRTDMLTLQKLYNIDIFILAFEHHVQR